MPGEIPDLNLFMMCGQLKKDALRELPAGYHIRNCRIDELNIWKAMPFDDSETTEQYKGFMTDYFNNVYGAHRDQFFEKCLFVCNEKDIPIGTCFVWKAYGKISTIHWYKVLKEYEGLGIGRALLSAVMKDLPNNEYPVYLHTQPSSYRAIKLYSDFGFDLLSNPVIGSRTNDLLECLPFLEDNMPEKEFHKLRISEAPASFTETVDSSDINQF